jgi:two-component system sensor histidine kinase EvgS
MPSVNEPVQADPVKALDLSRLLKLTGSDTGAVKELLAQLLDSLAADRTQLQALLEKHDYAQLHDLAHRTKGGARLVEAQTLVNHCEALEAACEQRDPEALVCAVAAVQEAIDQLHQALTDYCNQA